MPKGVLIYLSFHEPRRLRLPAAPVSKGNGLENLQDWIIDKQATESFVVAWIEQICQPYTQLLRKMMSDGARFLINVSGPLLEALISYRNRDRSALSFLNLLHHSKVAFACSEAKHSLSCYLDIEQFVAQTKRSLDLAQMAGISPVAAVAPYMFLSADIYHALARLPVSFVIADGCRDVLGGRSSAFLRRNGWGPYIITRNSESSLRIASLLHAPPEPLFELRAAEIAQQAADAEGDYVLLGWQVPSPTSQDAVKGGLRFLECLCGELLRREMQFIDLRRLVNNSRVASTSLPLPPVPAVSAEYGSLSYFLGHPVQQSVFGLMHQAYSVARLTGNERVVDHALDLAQWDLLSLVHRILMSNGHGQEPVYLTPEQWDLLGRNMVIGEIHKAIENFVTYVPELYL